MSLRSRILITVGPLLLLLLGLGVTGAVLLYQLGQRSDAILKENYDSVRAMNKLREAGRGIDAAFRLALDGKEDEAQTAYRVQTEELRKQLTLEEGNVTILPDEPRLVAELEELIAAFETAGHDFFRLPPGDPARKTANNGTANKPGLGQQILAIEETAAEIRDLNERQMQVASQQAQDTARLSVLGFLVGLVATGLIGLATVWWLQRAILGPIKAVTRASQTIGKGQLHLVVPVYGRDELGQLAEAFNGMTQKLRSYRQTNTERLLRARQVGQATIDSFPDPIIVLDTEGRVESANPSAQRLLGVRSPSDNETPSAWNPPEALRPTIAEALLSHRPTLTESFDQALSFRMDETDHQFLPQVRPIRAADGETLGAAVVLNDVTQFRLLDRLKSDWVATVSHELKTPLSSVRLAVHVLLEEVVGPLEPKQVELLLEARESTERLFELIEQLLALAKLEEGREQLDLKPTDAESFLRDVADAAASRAEDKHIEIRVHAPERANGAMPVILVDPLRFGHALNNLVDNALKYTETGGKIDLTVAPVPDGKVGLTVKDSGIGIPREYLPHVFDRFFRVPDTESSGTGLGLAIVREIVTAHGGDIVCESEPGKGTTFRITLPGSLGEAR